jgi:hypothetical protein
MTFARLWSIHLDEDKTRFYHECWRNLQIFFIVRTICTQAKLVENVYVVIEINAQGYLRSTESIKAVTTAVRAMPYDLFIGIC